MFSNVQALGRLSFLIPYANLSIVFQSSTDIKPSIVGLAVKLKNDMRS